MKRIFKNIGPGTLIAAAFIGPGTVTVCTIAGVTFGFELLWAMVLSIIATIVLQEMAARIGIITQNDLATTIKEQISHPIIKYISMGLILGAIVVGNAAYEAGNIGGASLGLTALFGEVGTNIYPFIIGVFAFILLFIGNYKFLEKCFVVLVVLMSLSFIITAIITKPDFGKIISGILIPSLPKASLLTIIALVGTTVVPYNLFLHAAIVKEKWRNKNDLKLARNDTYIAIILGGTVSLAIIISGAAINSFDVKNVLDLAEGLKPLYGDFAKYFLGIGLVAAGTTSAITAPLAAAYVANSCFGWNVSLKNWKFRTVWGIILMTGVLVLYFKIKLITIIHFAQVTNGILLPVIASFLLWVVNKRIVMGKYKNSKLQNLIGILIIVLAFVLGTRGVLKVFGV